MTRGRWHIPQRHFYAFFWACCRNATDRVRRTFGNVRGAIDRIDSDVELRRPGNPSSELFAFEDTRRFVFYSFADHHLAADVHEIEHAAHGVARRRIGRFLVAAPEPA